METADLVRAAAGGDAAAWEALVGRFSGLVWSVARARGLAQSDAEDVFQVTWLRLAQHAGRLKQPDRVGAWLAATCRNEAMRVSRLAARAVPHANLDDLAPPMTVDPEHVAVQAETEAAALRRGRALWQVFEKLSERCQELLRAMTATPALSYHEIAELFGMPVGSIGPTRARCLQKLRGLLGERGITGIAEDS